MMSQMSHMKTITQINCTIESVMSWMTLCIRFDNHASQEFVEI